MRPSSIVQTSPTRRSVGGCAAPPASRGAGAAARRRVRRGRRRGATRRRSRRARAARSRRAARVRPSAVASACALGSAARALARRRRGRRRPPPPRCRSARGSCASPLRVAALRAAREVRERLVIVPADAREDPEPHLDGPEERRRSASRCCARRTARAAACNSSARSRRPSAAAASASAAIAPNHRLSRGSAAKSSAARRSNSSCASAARPVARARRRAPRARPASPARRRRSRARASPIVGGAVLHPVEHDVCESTESGIVVPGSSRPIAATPASSARASSKRPSIVTRRARCSGTNAIARAVARRRARAARASRSPMSAPARSSSSSSRSTWRLRGVERQRRLARALGQREQRRAATRGPARCMSGPHVASCADDSANASVMSSPRRCAIASASLRELQARARRVSDQYSAVASEPSSRTRSGSSPGPMRSSASPSSATWASSTKPGVSANGAAPSAARAKVSCAPIERAAAIAASNVARAAGRPARDCAVPRPSSSAARRGTSALEQLERLERAREQLLGLLVGEVVERALRGALRRSRRPCSRSPRGARRQEVVRELGQVRLDRAAVDVLERLAGRAVRGHPRRRGSCPRAASRDQPVPEAVLPIVAGTSTTSPSRPRASSAARTSSRSSGDACSSAARLNVRPRIAASSSVAHGVARPAARGGGGSSRARRRAAAARRADRPGAPRRAAARGSRARRTRCPRCARGPRSASAGAGSMPLVSSIRRPTSSLRQAAEHEPAPGADDVRQRRLRLARALGHALVHRHDEQHRGVAQHPRDEVQRDAASPRRRPAGRRSARRPGALARCARAAARRARRRA